MTDLQSIYGSEWTAKFLSRSTKSTNIGLKPRGTTRRDSDESRFGSEWAAKFLSPAYIRTEVRPKGYGMSHGKRTRTSTVREEVDTEDELRGRTLHRSGHSTRSKDQSGYRQSAGTRSNAGSTGKTPLYSSVKTGEHRKRVCGTITFADGGSINVNVSQVYASIYDASGNQ